MAIEGVESVFSDREGAAEYLADFRKNQELVENISTEQKFRARDRLMAEFFKRVEGLGITVA